MDIPLLLLQRPQPDAALQTLPLPSTVLRRPRLLLLRPRRMGQKQAVEAAAAAVGGRLG